METQTVLNNWLWYNTYNTIQQSYNTTAIPIQYNSHTNTDIYITIQQPYQYRHLYYNTTVIPIQAPVLQYNSHTNTGTCITIQTPILQYRHLYYITDTYITIQQPTKVYSNYITHFIILSTDTWLQKHSSINITIFVGITLFKSWPLIAALGRNWINTIVSTQLLLTLSEFGVGINTDFKGLIGVCKKWRCVVCVNLN